MQSFLQYRSFKKSVKDQYERDRKKAEGLRLESGNKETDLAEGSEERRIGGNGASSIFDSNSSNTPVATSTDARDPEKAEQAPAEGQPSDGQHGRHEGDDGLPNGQRVERTQTTNTLRPTQTFGTAMGTVLTGIEVRQMTRQMSNKLERKNTRKNNKGNANIQPKDKLFVVNYESETDPSNPHNWSYGRRGLATMLIASIGFIVGFASSIDSSALPQASKDFGVGEVAESLATGIFLIGFGFGALFAGPISETVGRNPVYIVTMIM